MRPPICDVCNQDFSPSEGALITCVGTTASEAFEQRAELPGFVGHPPNQGWFCGDHRNEAERLAATMTLEEVTSTLRGAEGESRRAAPAAKPAQARVPDPPDEPREPALGSTEQVCAICGTVFEKATAGLVKFKRTQIGTDWHHAMLRGEVKGTSPDAAWLCARHVGPALWISRSHTRAEAMQVLAPPGRAPLEYDERPAAIDPDRDPDTFPNRTPFVPVADDALTEAPEEVCHFSPRPPRDVRTRLHRSIAAFGSATGVAELRSCGSTGTTSHDPVHERWGPTGTTVSVSHAPHQAGDVVIFLIGLIHRAGDRAGPIVQQANGLLVQKRERSLLEVWFVPEEPPTVAADDLVLSERAVIRQAPELDSKTALALGDALDVLLDELGGVVPDPLDPAPDLVGVDLGSGQIERSAFGSEPSWVRWKAGGSLPQVRATLVDSLPAFLTAVGVDDEIPLTATTNRRWNPMDGAQPPHCPFSDHWRWTGASGPVDVEITATSHNWSEDSVSNTSANLWVWVDGETLISLSHSERVDTGGDGPTLSLRRPTTAEVVAAVRNVFDC